MTDVSLTEADACRHVVAELQAAGTQTTRVLRDDDHEEVLR